MSYPRYMSLGGAGGGAGLFTTVTISGAGITGTANNVALVTGTRSAAAGTQIGLYLDNTGNADGSTGNIPVGNQWRYGTSIAQDQYGMTTWNLGSMFAAETTANPHGGQCLILDALNGTGFAANGSNPSPVGGRYIIGGFINDVASYSTGTIAIAPNAGGSIVTLTGGTWPAIVTNGSIVTGGNAYRIASRTDNTHIVLQNVNVTVGAGATYTLQQTNIFWTQGVNWTGDTWDNSAYPAAYTSYGAYSSTGNQVSITHSLYSKFSPSFSVNSYQTYMGSTDNYAHTSLAGRDIYFFQNDSSTEYAHFGGQTTGAGLYFPNARYIYGANSDNSANVPLIGINASNQVVLGDATRPVVIADSSASSVPVLDANKVLVSTTTGLAVAITPAELNTLHGISTGLSLQTQLNGKLDTTIVDSAQKIPLLLSDSTGSSYFFFDDPGQALTGFGLADVDAAYVHHFTATAATITTPLAVHDISISDTGTVASSSGSSATVGSATLSKHSGIVTTDAVTTGGLGTFTFTLTNTTVTATSRVYASVQYGSANAGSPMIGMITPASGSVVITIYNSAAATSINGTLKISFDVFN